MPVRFCGWLDSKTDSATVANVCAKLNISALVMVGGVRTQTDAANLAETFAVCVPCCNVWMLAGEGLIEGVALFSFKFKDCPLRAACGSRFKN